VEKWLFSLALSQALQLRLKNGFKKVAVALASKGVPHLVACEGVGEDTERSYSDKSVQNIAERLEKKKEREREREREKKKERERHRKRETWREREMERERERERERGREREREGERKKERGRKKEIKRERET
jgi:hypothetical protein